METWRKVAAAFIGLVIIIGVFFAAKWAGDRIKERFLKPKTPAPVITTKTVKTDNLLGEKTINTNAPTATYSAIPATGPNDWMYIILGLASVSGLGLLRLAKARN